MPILRLDPDPALCRTEPAVNDVAHGEPSLTEPESDRLRLTAVARTALDVNCHGQRYRWRQFTSPSRSLTYAASSNHEG